MSRWREDLPSDLREVLEDGRTPEPIPAVVRARALARARAVLEAGPGVARDIGASRGASRMGWAALAAVILMGVAAGGAAAAVYEIHVRERAVAVAEILEEPAARPVVRARAALVEAPADEAPRPSVLPSPSRADQAREERTLLKRAHLAVARHDFVFALARLSEHARRFKDGRLVEEREALRVQALAGLGRTEEARQTARQFEARFPRSPLLAVVVKLGSASP
jgi:hypothetical protein